MRAKLAAVQSRLGAVTEQTWPAAGARLRAKLVEMRSSLAAQLPDEEGTMANAKVRWLAFRRGVLPAYESLQLSLRELEIHVPTLRPTNTRRSVLHALGGLLAISILWFAGDSYWAVAVALPLAAFGWTLEFTRRRWPSFNDSLMQRLGPYAHPHEWRRINSATWYCSALAILSLTFHPLPSAIGLAALGLGDPMASTIGRRFGRRRLLHGRTLEGTLAFVLVVLFGGTLIARFFDPTLAWSLCVTLAASGAIAGALAELFSLRIDDNFSVPLFSAGIVTIVATSLGVM
jgi:dolichol kinase